MFELGAGFTWVEEDVGGDWRRRCRRLGFVMLVALERRG